MTDDRRRRAASRRASARSTQDWATRIRGDATTPVRTRSREALPNVLSSETIPNTLSGVGPPSRATRRGLTLPALAGILLLAILTVLVFLVGR